MKNDKKGEAVHHLPDMRHYVALTPDGMYHVQNIVGTMIGQHHVHTEQGYMKWKKGIDKKYLRIENAEFCPCGLEPGYVKEYDGRVWLNEKYK